MLTNVGSGSSAASPAAIPAPGVAGPESRARKRIGSAKAAAAQDRLIALVERGIAAVVVEALLGIGRAPASAAPRRLAPLRARPALGVSVGEQQSHYCDTEQNKTDCAHGSSPSPSLSCGQCKRRGRVAAEQANELAPLHLDDPKPKDYAEYSRSKPCIAAKAGTLLSALGQKRKTRSEQSMTLYPRKRTKSRHVGMSALCQKRTNAPQQKISLFDHLVGAGEQCRWDPETYALSRWSPHTWRSSRTGNARSCCWQRLQASWVDRLSALGASTICALGYSL